MRDTTNKAYTIYHCDEVIDEVAWRLTCNNWYGYKQFHDHFACVVVSGKQIELYFHPYTGYQALVIADGAPTYYSIKRMALLLIIPSSGRIILEMFPMMRTIFMP